MCLAFAKGREVEDNRSSIECGLAMEVCEAFDLFVDCVKHQTWLTKDEAMVTLVTSVNLISNLVNKLREQNYSRLSELGVMAILGSEQLPRSRTMKTRTEWESDIRADITMEAHKNTKRSQAGSSASG